MCHSGLSQSPHSWNFHSEPDCLQHLNKVIKTVYSAQACHCQHPVHLHQYPPICKLQLHCNMPFGFFTICYTHDSYIRTIQPLYLSSFHPLTHDIYIPVAVLKSSSQHAHPPIFVSCQTWIPYTLSPSPYH